MCPVQEAASKDWNDHGMQGVIAKLSCRQQSLSELPARIAVC